MLKKVKKLLCINLGYKANGLTHNKVQKNANLIQNGKQVF
tara:strand:- start:324 stop:443 length:120 start_codon:yes stop_codon:yes gene_type:complete